jgi:hypothetical protein
MAPYAAERWKSYGYTHILEYDRLSSNGVWLETYMATTEDSVSFHVNSLWCKPEIRNIKVVKL